MTAISSTYLSLYYHLIFSTADREPSIGPEWRARLHDYLGGTANRLDGQSLGVGGTNDHVHPLVELKATHCLADFMRELKKASSVRRYIENQEDNHRKMSFRQEVLTLLRRSGVEVNERFFN